MLKYGYIFFFLSCASVVFGQNAPTNGYEIKLEIKPFTNQKLYLRHYFGYTYPVVDSAMLNAQSEVVFRGTTPLKGGIYLVYYPENAGVLNLVIDTSQHFSAKLDLRNDNGAQAQFTNSPENVLLDAYQQQMLETARAIEDAQEQLIEASNHADSAQALQVLHDSDQKIQAYRNDIIQKQPNSFLSKLFVAMREPSFADLPQQPTNHADSILAHQYVQNHYWDGVQFWDGRLAYTPFFEGKMDKYCSEVLYSQADTVIKNLDKIMPFVATSDEMTELLLPQLLYGSMYHKYKWEDAVYLYLFDNYVANKSYPWLSAEDKQMLTDHAYFLMSNTKGKPATEIELPAPDGTKPSLLAVSATYTLLVFWDPTCHHCLQTLPKLDSIYQAKWKAAGMHIFSVATESSGTREDWLNCITTKHLQGWTNVYNSLATEKELAESGKNLPLKDYNVWYFPAFFLLDKDKQLMAKKLSYPQMVDFFETILKKEKE